MKSLSVLLQPNALTHVVDIGANPIDGDPPYKEMLRSGLCKVTGFEPQTDALAALMKTKGLNETYLPYAVGDGSSKTLNICRASGMTSLFEPDEVNLSLFDVLRPLGEVTQRIPIETKRLDDITEVSPFDMLKIDVQGGELDVFRAGRNHLKNAVVIQTEVSFITLYKKQPTLGDIDIELRAQGFIPHCFAGLKKWPIHPCVINGDPREPLQQLLEADLVYVRNFLDPNAIRPEQLKQLALIAHHCYGSIDLAMRCIQELQKINHLGHDALDSYIHLLQQQ